MPHGERSRWGGPEDHIGMIVALIAVVKKGNRATQCDLTVRVLAEQVSFSKDRVAKLYQLSSRRKLRMRTGMNRRNFLIQSTAATVAASLSSTSLIASSSPDEAGVTVLVIDTDRASTPIDKRIYGQFLEHINHSVEDGLFAEQIRGAGFEGPDFETYWEPISQQGRVEIAELDFQNGKKSVCLRVSGGEAGIRQRRVFLDANTKYEGSLWVKREDGFPKLTIDVVSSSGDAIASLPVGPSETEWHEFPFSFTSHLDTQASIEITASGHGEFIIDFVSLMRADARHDGTLRPDLLAALRGLEPSFIRWPGGSFASTYKWRDAIGPYAARGYHPNVYWGN